MATKRPDRYVERHVLKTGAGSFAHAARAGRVAVAAAACVLLAGCTPFAAPRGDSEQGSERVAGSAASDVPTVLDSPGSSAARQESSDQAGEKSAPEHATTWLDEAHRAVERELEAYGDAVSVTCVALTGGSDLSAAHKEAGSFSIDGSARRVSASMIKLAVLACALDDASAGELSLDEQLTVTDGDLVGGSGVVQSLGAGSYTVRDLIGYMISDSDNVATNVLIDRLGMEHINASIERRGLEGTVLARKMMDDAAAAEGRENYMSSDDAAALLAEVACAEQGSAELSALARDCLLDQHDAPGIADGVPEDVAVAHKTGTLAGAEHDGGIVYAEHPYVLVVMTEGLSEQEALGCMARVSAAVYDASENARESEAL